MGFPFRRQLPVERPPGPLRGHKLAYPMLSGDGRTAGFRGVWSSAQPVYGVRDTAVCFWNDHHSPPERRCGCGFYCFHSPDAARAMACEGQYRSTVILEVDLFGRFIRYEEGFRYSDQRILAVHLNRCRGSKEIITPTRFGALLGDPALIKAEATPSDRRSGPGVPDTLATAPEEDVSSLSVLTAEIALLQARVDSLQAQLSRLSN
jgi:hypothetical protein